jgi:hypothetical protein
MLKKLKLGIPIAALVAMLTLISPPTANAAVRFGVSVGGPVYTYPAYPYYAYPAYPYYYSYPRSVYVYPHHRWHHRYYRYWR